MGASAEFDFDWVVIGSGFGGSASALRLAEKGYSVCVLECGRRFADDELPDTMWNLRDCYWAPRLGLMGITRLTFFRDLAIVSGAGVGGGSLVFANTLYRASERFLHELDRAIGQPAALGRFYDTAERMLGVVTHPRRTKLDELAIATATDLGYGSTFRPSRVGIFYGTQPGVTVPDPYFDGEGPDRTGCIECGACLLGCKHGAKNHTMKNYLWLAERRGVVIRPQCQVTDIQPLAAANGADGYAIVHRDPRAVRTRTERVVRARAVVVAAGALGTNLLLAGCRASGSLPALSSRLGEHVRSNSESICAVTARDRDADYTNSVTLTGSVFPDRHTHIEVATYGAVGDSFGLNFVPLTGDGSRVTRPLKLLANVVRRPRDFLESQRPTGYSRRTVFVAAMQTHDNALRLRARRRWLGRGVRLATEQDPQRPNPTFIPEIYAFTRRLAERVNGIPQSWLTEALANIPVTAHILGGAVIGTSPENGVIDPRHRVFGYENLLVCDGSAVPANPGYNPSLTITAMAERAMSLVPARAAEGEGRA